MTNDNYTHITPDNQQVWAAWVVLVVIVGLLLVAGS